MLFHVKQIYELFDKSARRRAALLLCMILVQGFLEMAGVGSMMPFVAVLANPKIVETNRYLSLVYNELGFTSPQEFLFIIGVVVFGVIVGGIIGYPL